MKSYTKWIAGLSLIAGALYGIAVLGDWFINDYPPGRIWYRLQKAQDIYEYEEIHPRYLETNPADLINLSSHARAKSVRQQITQAIFGQTTIPYDLMPDAVTEQSPGSFADMVSQSFALDLSVDPGHVSVAEVFWPKQKPQRVVLYHHGYAGTFWKSEALIRDLLSRNVAVIAFNQAGYGRNDLPGYFHPKFGHYQHQPHEFMVISGDPMGYFFKPVTAAINWVTQVKGISRVDMVGLSNGGWQTAVQAAFDPRIQISVPVAGVYPLYLTWGNISYSRPPEHFYRPLIHAANYLEMFVLAADTPNRTQVQIFNRYDKCCYMNLKGKLYEKAVAQTVNTLSGGHFSVEIDNTHADHQISDYGRRLVLEALGF